MDRENPIPKVTAHQEVAQEPEGRGCAGLEADHRLDTGRIGPVSQVGGLGNVYSKRPFAVDILPGRDGRVHGRFVCKLRAAV